MAEGVRVDLSSVDFQLYRIRRVGTVQGCLFYLDLNGASRGASLYDLTKVYIIT